MFRSWNKRIKNSRRIYQEKNEENSHSKSLNHKLLEQIRKLKEEKLENPSIKSQEDANLDEEKTYQDVGVQTMEDPGKLTNQN